MGFFGCFNIRLQTQTEDFLNSPSDELQFSTATYNLRSRDEFEQSFPKDRPQTISAINGIPRASGVGPAPLWPILLLSSAFLKVLLSSQIQVLEQSYRIHQAKEIFMQLFIILSFIILLCSHPSARLTAKKSDC